MRILISGGAGFVGSHLARAFKRELPASEVVAFDNLKRRGSELNLKNFVSEGIQFVHGDIRNPSDFESLSGNFDIFVEASAEPSVLAGLQGSPRYLLETNLSGTLNCLEFARAHAGTFLFLSTSRVYSIGPLRNVRFKEGETRLEIEADQTVPGVGSEGISENFTTQEARSLYGATKLASELVVQEYAATYGLRTVINRCGVLAGPGQFGKVDQGVFTLWVANHYFGQPLRYTGFGGQGKQVRDLLHPADLYDLLKLQLGKVQPGEANVFNVGGGIKGSVSLKELTALCEKTVGKKVKIGSSTETNPVDVPLYVSDNAKVQKTFGWQPKISVAGIVEEIHGWIRRNESELRPLFAAPPPKTGPKEYSWQTQLSSSPDLPA